MLANAVHIILILACFVSIGHLTDTRYMKCIYENVNVYSYRTFLMGFQCT
jgi:hypothetical protein